MQIKELEASVGAQLFQRQSSGVVPTKIGERLYQHATRLVRYVSDIREDMRAVAGAITGEIHVGLMPTFTRAVLAPALIRFTTDYPHVNVRVTEAYSKVLAEYVANQTMDFALVPTGQLLPGITSRYLQTDREFLVTSPDTARPHLSPVDLAGEMTPLKLILPSRANARRDRIERHLAGSGVQISAMLEMDAMMGTLELVARSDWVTILPGVLCAPDHDGKLRKIHPLANPALDVGYSLIQPSTRSLPVASQLFATALEEELEKLIVQGRLPLAGTEPGHQQKLERVSGNIIS